MKRKRIPEDKKKRGHLSRAALQWKERNCLRNSLKRITSEPNKRKTTAELNEKINDFMRHESSSGDKEADQCDNNEEEHCIDGLSKRFQLSGAFHQLLMKVS